MITILEGAPGHGKSYSLVKEIADTVHRGEPVATNVPLRADWPVVMARRYTLFPSLRKKAVEEKARKYARLVYVSDELEDLMRVRLAGKGEGRGKLIIDESHREMNTRTFRSDKRRLDVVNAMSAHRHYGWNMVLATQDEKNLDTQVRGLYEFKSVVRNFKRLPFIAMVCPFNIFLRVTTWNDRAKTKAGVSLYGLNKGLARLYDTHALEHKDWPEDAIILPMPDESRLPEIREHIEAVNPIRARAITAYIEACEREAA